MKADGLSKKLKSSYFICGEYVFVLIKRFCSYSNDSHIRNSTRRNIDNYCPRQPIGSGAYYV